MQSRLREVAVVKRPPRIWTAGEFGKHFIIGSKLFVNFNLIINGIYYFLTHGQHRDLFAQLTRSLKTQSCTTLKLVHCPFVLTLSSPFV